MVLFARELPQMVYAGLMMLLQQEWKFVCRVTPGFGTLFVSLEAELWDEFLLALLGGRREEVTESLYKRIT